MAGLLIETKTLIKEKFDFIIMTCANALIEFRFMMCAFKYKV